MDIETINSILDWVSSHPIEKNEDSFFDIIERGHDEDLISRMLKYLFEQNLEILNGLLKNRTDISISEIKTIDCEKTIDNGQRMDLFIDGFNQKGEEIIIVIENKVNSWEHDHQCKAYHDDINRKYPQAHCIYFYLKPKYNLSTPEEKSEFKKITYDDIYEILAKLDKRSKFEEDFMITIKNNLMECTMEDVDYKILSHYNELQARIDQNLKVFKNFNESLASLFAEELHLKFECGDKHMTYRLYNEEYRDSNQNYYFYVEFKYENNDFSKLYVQKTIQRFERTGNSLISKFAEKKNFEKPDYGLWYVLKREKIEINSLNVLSDEWKKEVETKVKEKIKELNDELTKLYLEFIEFKNQSFS